MADAQTGSATQANAGAASALTVPDEIQKQFPDLIALIKGSESMNDQERQYWVNILPIMTPDQIQNLRDILDNEKKQLAAIDEKYNKEVEQLGQAEAIKETEQDRQKRREQRTSTEESAKKEEDAKSEAILQQIEEAQPKQPT